MLVEALKYIILDFGLFWILMAAWFCFCAAIGAKLVEHIWEG